MHPVGFELTTQQASGRRHTPKTVRPTHLSSVQLKWTVFHARAFRNRTFQYVQSFPVCLMACPQPLADYLMTCPQPLADYLMTFHSLFQTILWHVHSILQTIMTCPQPLPDYLRTCPQPLSDYLMTCPQSLPEPALHRVPSNASSFDLQCPIISWRPSSTCFRHQRNLLGTSLRINISVHVVYPPDVPCLAFTYD